MNIFLHKTFFQIFLLLFAIPTLEAQILIHFDHNSYALKSAETEKIKQIIQSHKDVIWGVNGRASSSGSELHNNQLSINRLQAVVNVMEKEGIAKKNIIGSHNGEDYANQEMDNSEDRVVIISFSEQLVPEKKSEEIIVAKKSPVEISVWDAIDKKQISGSFIIDGIKNDFVNTFKVESEQKQITISSTGFTDTMLSIKLTDKAIRVELFPENVIEKLGFDKIYFFPNTPEIIPESFRVLDDLYAQLKNQKDIKIEIRGHVNWPVYQETSEDLDQQHLRLSEQRALAVMKWLIKKGISEEVLSYKGFGASQMLFPNAISEGEQARNRRVEVLLLRK